MGKYLITYDLNSPDQKYTDVLKVIRNEISNGYCSYWESAYLVNSSYTPEQITRLLQPYFDESDRLLVIEVKPNYQGLHDEKEWDFISKIMQA
ncbi:hypothetical protein [Streptomyces pharetrae]|uniref:hypothetical protein n=1 Tax=Streptomyces pharetrae TaxID=291370 RepID=UPI0036C763D7